MVHWKQLPTKFCKEKELVKLPLNVAKVQEIFIEIPRHTETHKSNIRSETDAAISSFPDLLVEEDESVMQPVTTLKIRALVTLVIRTTGGSGTGQELTLNEGQFGAFFSKM